MQSFTDFDSMIAHLAGGEKRVKVAVVCPHDDHTCGAVAEATRMGIADFILIGDPRRIDATLADKWPVVEAPDGDAAAALAVEMAREGRADIIMKGLLNTDNLLRAVLNKTTGILPPGNVLSHVTAAQISGHGRLLFFADAAVIPFPDGHQFRAIVGNLVDTCHRAGIAEPRVALIHCSEKTSPKFPVTTSYSDLRAMSARGEFGDAIVDGPMDVKTALDRESGAIKGIESAVCGRADALVFPDIEAANVFYKTISWLAHSTNAGMLLGAAVPVVLPSRSDSTHSKLCSLALAATWARG